MGPPNSLPAVSAHRRPAFGSRNRLSADNETVRHEEIRGGQSATRCCQAWDRNALCGRPTVHERAGQSRRVRHACTCGAGSTRVPSGDGRAHHWGGDHRTLWQSEESGLRRHGVPQTTRQAHLPRASWVLNRNCPRSSAAAEAAMTGARRAD